MTQSLWVPGPLPGLNEIVAAAKIGGRGRAYSSQKHSWTDTVALLAKRLTPVAKARIEFLWVEKNRRRDPDNFIAAKKFCLDGLVRAGVLPGDGWAHIEDMRDLWCTVDIGGRSRGPGVLVTLTAA